nr:uncharacterized protein LOC109150807 [Ipomoea batatas]
MASNSRYAVLEQMADTEGSQVHTTGRGAHVNRAGRGGIPRRAAAEYEHTVVRGSKTGKQTISTVVNNQYDPPESSRRNDMDYELLGDPPDAARTFLNMQEDNDATMSEEFGLDQGVQDQ